jgi:hypothetical protein
MAAFLRPVTVRVVRVVRFKEPVVIGLVSSKVVVLSVVISTILRLECCGRRCGTHERGHRWFVPVVH